jgi:DNA-binding MarR family transcriptional regulator
MEIIKKLIRLAKKLEQQQYNAVLDQSIHKTDIDVLARIKNSEEPFRLTPSQLLESVLITSGAMTASLNRLQKKGLVIRFSDISDGRVSYAGLTKKGEQLSNDILKQQNLYELRLFEDFDELEKRQLRLLIKKLIDQLVVKEKLPTT